MTGGGRLSSAEAVEVYRGAYPARMSEALGETFEACWRVLGDEDFLSACADYSRATPSRTHNLSDYGADFPRFLLARAKDHAPFIADLGRLEWEFKELFHREPHRGLPAAELASRAKPDSRLVIGAASALLALEHRVLAVWRRDRADATPLSPADWTGTQTVLLYKDGGSDVFSRELDAPSFAALSALRAGAPLDAALESAAGMTESSAAGLFSFLASSGLVTEVA